MTLVNSFARHSHNSERQKPSRCPQQCEANWPLTPLAFGGRDSLRLSVSALRSLSDRLTCHAVSSRARSVRVALLWTVSVWLSRALLPDGPVNEFTNLGLLIHY